MLVKKQGRVSIRNKSIEKGKKYISFRIIGHHSQESSLIQSEELQTCQLGMSMFSNCFVVRDDSLSLSISI